MRQAWHWLGRWHDPLSVGAAVALIGLVYLMPVRGEPAQRSPAAQPQSTATLALQTPADAQYYRDQWSREAAQFYALHPPRPDKTSALTNVAPEVKTAKASYVQLPAAGISVTQAAHVTAASPRPPVAAVAAPTPQLVATTAGPPEWIQRWRIAASLAAGLLAGFAFVSVWPASSVRCAAASAASGDDAAPPSDRASAAAMSPLAAEADTGEVIAIRLPAAWVGVRPTSGETLRRVILAASYLSASLCGWSLLG